MSETDTPSYDNSWLIPYLRLIRGAGPSGLDKMEADIQFRRIFDLHASETDEYPGAAKIRQTMYVAGLAKSGKEFITITAKGEELIDNG